MSLNFTVQAKGRICVLTDVPVSSSSYAYSFYNSCVEKCTLLRNVWLINVTSLRMWVAVHVGSYNIPTSWMVLARI